MASREEQLGRLSDFPDRLASRARGASRRPVPEGEWTPEQVVRHLIAVDVEVHQARLRDLTSRGEPQWSWQERGPWPDEPGLGLEGVLARFAEVRERTASALRSLGDAGWARAGRHATFGRLDADGILRLIVDHDEEHLAGLA